MKFSPLLSLFVKDAVVVQWEGMGEGSTLAT